MPAKQPNVVISEFDPALVQGRLKIEQIRQFLKNRVCPQSKAECPVDSTKRRVPVEHFQTYAWLTLSKSTNGLFCLPCFLMNKSEFDPTYKEGSKQAFNLVHNSLTNFRKIMRKGLRHFLLRFSLA